MKKQWRRDAFIYSEGRESRGEERCIAMLCGKLFYQRENAVGASLGCETMFMRRNSRRTALENRPLPCNSPKIIRIRLFSSLHR